MLAEFVYGGEVTPTLPLSPFKESAFYWQVKKRALPPFYFDYMLKGREGDIAHKQRGQGKSGPGGHFLGPCKLRIQSTIRASRSDNNPSICLTVMTKTLELQHQQWLAIYDDPRLWGMNVSEYLRQVEK